MVWVGEGGTIYRRDSTQRICAWNAKEGSLYGVGMGGLAMGSCSACMSRTQVLIEIYAPYEMKRK